MAQEQQVEISCGEGAGTYAAVVTAQNLDFFLEAGKQPDVTGKSGEALVAALQALAKRRLAIMGIERRKDGKWNDGPNGEPAFQEFNDAGTLVYAARWKDGRRNDGPNGEPAVQKFNDAGTLVYAARYKDGELVKELSAGEICAWIEQQKAREKAAAIKAAFGDRLKLRPSP